MSETKATASGVPWIDLTSPNAEALAGFYRDVMGWTIEATDMGTYEDYTMKAGGQPVAGVCHPNAAGPLGALPPVWMAYFPVEDVDASARRCREHGGEVLAGPTDMGSYGRFAAIRDPEGTVCAIFTPPAG